MPTQKACKATSSKLSETWEMSQEPREMRGQVYRRILEIRIVNPQIYVDREFFL
jgi:hypothetical protein